MFKGSMVALITPLQADGRVGFDTRQRRPERHSEAGADGDPGRIVLRPGRGSDFQAVAGRGL